MTSGFDQAYALAQAEGSAAALLRFPQETNAIVFALLERGRADEALTVPGILADARGLALLQLGRLDEAAAVLTAQARSQVELRGCRAIAALAAGDAALALRLAVRPERWNWTYESRWSSHAYDPCFGNHFAAFVLPALVAWQTDGTDPRPAWRELAAVQRNLASLRVDHRWRGLLSAAGPADVLDQPFRSAGHPAREAALVAALRADLAGGAGVADLWRAYLAIASPFDAAARAWARQRLAKLSP